MRICLPPRSPPISCCSGRTRGLAGYWRTVALLDSAAGRALLGLAPAETPVGILYLGAPLQEQRVPERAPVAEILSRLD